MSLTQQTGINIAVFKPTITAGTSYVPRGVLVADNVGAYTESYQHDIAANGGYWSARFVIKDRQAHLEDWMLRAGHHVAVYDPSLSVIWEGFINRVALNLGPASFVTGPLTDIGNNVAVVFSELDTTPDEPVWGMRQKTEYRTNTTSQGKYGIVEKIISVGGARPVNARQIRDTWLAENAEVLTSQESNNQAQIEPSATIECVGYWWFLKAYTWNYTANSGTQAIDAQIQAVLGGDTNGLFSTDYSKIDTNALAVKRYTDEDNTAWDWIMGLVAHGDASDNRYTFGIYANQRAVYAQQPTTLEYVQRLADPKQRVETQAGAEVKPWNVLPARWLFYPDFLIGRTLPSSLRLDPRYEFIERVTYSAPWGLRHYGGRSDTLSQKLAKLGLGGTAV